MSREILSKSALPLALAAGLGLSVSFAVPTAAAAQDTAPAEPQRPQRSPAQGNPRALIDALDHVAKTMDLEEATRDEIRQLISDATEDFRIALTEAGDNRQAGRQKAMQIGQQLTRDIAGVLPEDKRRAFTAAVRAEMRNPTPTTRPATIEPQTPYERLQVEVARLDLEPADREKVNAAVIEFAQTLQEIGQNAAAEPEEMREAMAPALAKLRRGLGEVLSPRQVRGLMQAMRNERTGDRRPAADTSPPTGSDTDMGGSGDSMMGSDDTMMGGDDTMMGGGDAMTEGAFRTQAGQNSQQRFNRDDARFAEQQRRRADQRRRSSFLDAITDSPGIDLGDEMPDIAIHQLAGNEIQLSSLLPPQGSGRPLVVVLGSGSSPTFRDRCGDMAWMVDQLRDRGNRTADLVVVYTREQHPASEDQPDRNVEAELTFREHTDLDARIEAARQLKAWANLRVDVYVDDMNNTALKELAGGEIGNAAFVFDASGKLVARQQWFDPTGMVGLINLAREEMASE